MRPTCRWRRGLRLVACYYTTILFSAATQLTRRCFLRPPCRLSQRRTIRSMVMAGANNNENDDGGASPPRVRLPSLEEFLRQQQRAPTPHAVLGNEAGDADSIVSALAWAYTERLLSSSAITIDTGRFDYSRRPRNAATGNGLVAGTGRARPRQTHEPVALYRWSLLDVFRKRRTTEERDAGGPQPPRPAV